MEQQMNRQLTRRNFLRISAGLAGAAALTACVPPAAPSGGDAAAPAAAGPAQIDVWTGWTEDAATNIRPYRK